MMTSRSYAETTERPPKPPGPTGLTLTKTANGSYVQRFKIQKERIKTLHSEGGEGESGGNSTTARAREKTLPKITVATTSVDREATGVKKFIRSDTIKSIKLPGVSSGSTYAQYARRRQPVPVKTYQLKLNSELSKSLSSLPSIPGSPSLEKGDTLISDNGSEFKISAFPANHRYQKIAFQKTIHSEKSSLNAAATDFTNAEDIEDDTKSKGNHFQRVYGNSLPRRPHRHQPRYAATEPDTSRSFVDLTHGRYRRNSTRKDSISDTRSEGNYYMDKKWKDDCECLRCQMLRRQYKEGDEMYKLWGLYPCHRVDPSVVLDDD